MRTLDVKTDAALQRFVVNLYRFAEEALHQENEQNFPVLDLLGSRVSHNLSIYLKAIGAAERNEFVCALIDWGHRSAIELLGRPFLIEMPETLRTAFKTCLHPSKDEAKECGFLLVTKRPKEKLNKVALWKAMRSEIRRITGDSGFVWGPNERRFEVKLREWTLATHLDAGGWGGGLRLHQQIQTTGNVFLDRFFSYPSILGFPIMAEWSMAGAGEEESVARRAAMVAERIISQMPRLLEGVSYP